MPPLHWATRMLATPSATFQSPVGSSAKAGARPVAKIIPEYTTLRMMFRGQCNMSGPMLKWMSRTEAKRRIERFQLTNSVDEMATNRSM
jgi:hypothetical protein